MTNWKFSLLTSLFLIAWMRSEAQELTVFDEESQKPLLGVLISSKEPKTNTLTNEAGKASIAS
ncbi:MAG: hypothetical protein O3A40_05220, partial [Bacteroidetes bacterium]|nr:hypothetical protein [Bacteroidota bacterium]